MANLAIAFLLLALTLAITFFCQEPFEVIPGEVTCKHIERVGEPDTCSVQILENEDTMEMDVKCRPAAIAMGSQGIYQRTKYSILNNGRFAKRDNDPNICSLILSDDLVQGTQGPFCATGNPNLFDSKHHSGLIGTIEQNGPYCNIEFKTNEEEDIKKYIEFLSTKATSVAMRPRN